MKKLSLLLLLSVFIFSACSNDDEIDTLISFENRLTEANSQFISTSTHVDGYYYVDNFQDNNQLVTLNHYYSVSGSNYYFSAFTYMNKSDNQTSNSPAPISGKAKTGTTYIAAYSNDYTPALITINNPDKYAIKGVWITNSTYAYNGMIKGDAYAIPFKKGGWYKVTATGYDKQNKSIGSAEIYLANYTNDNDKPISDWIWFNLSGLANATSIKFIPSSSDTGENGMRTSQNFCLDGITLTEK